MNSFRTLVAVLLILAAIVVYVLHDPGCSDKSKEPVGAQHPVECKP